MNRFTTNIAKLMFFGRWIQLPLYFGLLIALVGYVYRFIIELIELMGHVHAVNDVHLMLGVLDLIDVVMIANLLIMVVLGGYATFVSNLDLGNHPDQPEWLDHLDAGALKIKLALALVSISSIHLLRTFIDVTKQSNEVIMWQVIIHMTLLVSALTIAYTCNHSAKK